MNHEELIALLHGFARGKLNDGERLIVQRALENDPALGEELDRIRAYYNDLKHLPDAKAPDDFLIKVRNRIEQKGFFKKLRDLVFFPLYLKLPVEIAGTVAVSLLIIMVFNPFSPKIHVNMQENTSFSNHDVVPESNSYNNNKNNDIGDNIESIYQKDKVGEKSTAKEDGKVALKSVGGQKRRTIQQEASFTESMPAAQTSSRASEKEDVNGQSAEKSAEKTSEVVGRMDNAIRSSGEIESAKRSEAPASAPAAPNASAGAPMAEQQHVEPLAYTWIPEASTGYSSEAKEMASEIRLEKKAMRLDETDKRAPSKSKQEYQLSDHVAIRNELKSDELEYLLTSVKRAGGNMKVLNERALQYRIKIPAKNFKQLEMDLNKRGIISKSSSGEIDSNKYSSKELIEAILTIDLKK